MIRRPSRSTRTDTLIPDTTRCRSSSWITEERKMERNVEPMVAKYGGTLGTILAGAYMWMRTRKIGLPFTMKHHPDNEGLLHKDQAKPIVYPRPDGVIKIGRAHV